MSTVTNLNISGVYKIESKVHPERIYIGSAVNIKNRWRNHLSDLNKNKHSSKKLQRHYNKYGKNDLTFYILAICPKEYLIPINGVIWIETFFIHAFRYDGDNKAYFNNVPTGGSNIGMVHSAESKQKASTNRKGKGGWSKGLTKETHPSLMASAEKRTGGKRSEETRKKQSDKKQGLYVGEKHPMFGKHHKQETKDKLRDANVGKKQSAETIEKRAAKQRGRKMPKEFGDAISKRMKGNQHGKGSKRSIEAIEKTRQANIGRKATPEAIKNMSDAHIGKKDTEEQKKKKSIAMIEWWGNTRIERKIEIETERYFKERDVA